VNRRGAGLLVSICFASTVCHGQGLAPRAYTITPTGSNAITLTEIFNDGSVVFDGAIPISGAGAQINIPTLSYYHALDFFGRSANITVSLPYGVGNLSGKLVGVPESIYRSGLADSEYRFSVNLMGAPAMPIEEFRSWRQKTLIGASLTVVAPTGQYDPAKLINEGSNRWAFKPEIGLSKRRNRWVLDAYGAVWFFTANSRYYTGHLIQTEQSVGAVEMHLSYDVKPRLWFSLDGNFWYGGATSLNGVENSANIQRNSREGVTASIPISKHQSLKFSYSAGTYVRFGGDFQSISVAWQYGWVPQPR
jgi:hypothetical protein